MKYSYIIPVFLSLILVIAARAILGPGLIGGESINGQARIIMEIGIIVLFPISPILYGWMIKKAHGAVVLGVLPSLILFLMNGLYSELSMPFTPVQILIIAAYGTALSLLGGLGGYFAAMGSYKNLSIALCCGFAWGMVFISGIS